MGKFDYPEGIVELIQEKVATTVINGAKIADELGNAKTMDVVLFGALVKAMNLTNIPWEDVIVNNVKEKF